MPSSQLFFGRFEYEIIEYSYNSSIDRQLNNVILNTFFISIVAFIHWEMYEISFKVYSIDNTHRHTLYEFYKKEKLTLNIKN